MPVKRVAWGRDACVYVSADGYGLDDLVQVERLKDVTTVETADDLKATARDLETAVHGQGAKEWSIEAEKLLLEADPAADVALLRDAYDAGTELYVLVTTCPLDQSGGEGVRFRGLVFGWPQDAPEDGPSPVNLVLKPSDVDRFPERVSTPYTFTDPELLMEGGDQLLLEDGGLLLLEG